MRATDFPKVSVLTPIYNTKPQYLKECIESILKQTFTDFEFLILNDSPDNREIEKIVLEYAERDPRIRYRRNEKNLGISASRNKLLEWARGEYVAVFDHDDISVPERLAKEVEVLDKNPRIGVVGGYLYIISRKTVLKQPINNFEIMCELTQGCCVKHSACMIRRSVLQEHQIQYEQNFSPCEDHMLFLRLVPYTMFYNIPDVMIHYRDEEGNTSHRESPRMTNGEALCLCYAEKEYPYLSRMASRPYSDYWIRLFDCIPLVKVKYKPGKIKIMLFGFLPLFSVKP